MTSSTLNVKQKKRGRPATGKSPIVGVRVTPYLNKALEQVLLDPEFPVTNMSEAVRYILLDWLLTNKFMVPSDNPLHRSQLEHGVLKLMPNPGGPDFVDSNGTAYEVKMFRDRPKLK